MSTELTRVVVGRNCVHGGVMYGKGDYAVAPFVARMMERNGDLAAPLAGAEKVSLDDYDAERMRKDVPPPADLRTGYGATQVAQQRALNAAVLNAAEQRTDNEPSARNLSDYDMGGEGNFLETGEGDAFSRAPEGGREDMSGIVGGGSPGDVGGYSGASGGGAASTGAGASGGGDDRSGVLIAQKNDPLPGSGEGDKSGVLIAQKEGEPPTGYAQTSPGVLTPTNPDPAAGAQSNAGTVGLTEDDPKAEFDAGNPPPVAAPDAPLRGEIPDGFPKRAELAKAGITSLEQLSGMNREQLIGVKGIGEKTADSVGLALYEMVERNKGAGEGGGAE